MVMYGPYIAVIFWGVMIFFGLRSGFTAGKAQAIAGPLRDITGKMGVITWAAVAILYVLVLVLARVDSENIRNMRSPVGLATSAAFIPLVLADALLAAKLFLGGKDGGSQSPPPSSSDDENAE